jgi:transcriptional regulator with XRE-family HTH domain
MFVIGEAEQRKRFAYALQKAMAARNMSGRALAASLGVDARRVSRWLQERDLPNLYEAQLLAATLRVDEDLFRNPPEAPDPPPEPYYPLEKYLLGAVDQGARRGLTQPLPEPEERPSPSPRRSRRRPPGRP